MKSLRRNNLFNEESEPICHFSFTQTHSQNDELKSNAKDVIHVFWKTQQNTEFAQNNRRNDIYMRVPWLLFQMATKFC